MNPEQDLINKLVWFDLAGVDEDTWEEYETLCKQLSPEGHIERKREVDKVLRHLATLDAIPEDSTKH